MDFSKFISLLETRSLHFTSLEVLAERFDKFEGHYPYPAVPMKDTSGTMQYLPLETFRGFELTKKGGFVNCWHINEGESYAMWKVYSNMGEGIAIRSTIQNLWDSFAKNPNDILVGEVDYDFEVLAQLPKEKWPRFDPKILYLHKTSCFSYEKELRAIIEIASLGKDGFYVPSNYSEGIDLQVKLNELVEKIFVSPYSPEWYKPLIEKILIRYNLNKKVEQSIIDAKPL